MFAFAAPRRRRRPSLTPMIDVVFLLLVFFMLAARFGQDAGIELGLAGGGGAWSGPPRLVELTPDESRLNGVAVDMPGLVAGLGRLTDSPADPIVIRPAPGTDLQRLADVLAALRAAGFSALALVE
ncbi:biopolymer transport protein ExbD [Rhodovulum iodosum]|uniref:Biopolymer transport protein ExbD n=1 Tax=Rhodovulum iodosum TaxID=68291 RepID=A0ABV3XMV4_9RHOB|nr:biopolymer transporter ExbD [Rhodovulum robiginosum]RSK35793.1 biopolymer transporter ExbD [Rhodovulum robiginosum]